MLVWLAFLNVVLVVGFMVGLWAIDISVSGMLVEEGGIYATGIFGIRTLNEQYHLGILYSIASIIFLSIINICLIAERKR